MALREELQSMDIDSTAEAYITIRQRIEQEVADPERIRNYEALQMLGELIIEDSTIAGFSQDVVDLIKVGAFRVIHTLIEVAEVNGLQSDFPDMPQSP